jgi:ATP-dependent DNA ligase
VKQKHRRRERFVVTGWREREGALTEFFLARTVGNELHPAGTASLGLDPERREQLLSGLAERALKPLRRRRGVH